jgi:hypothetical protein
VSYSDFKMTSCDIIIKVDNGELYGIKCEEGDIMFEQHKTGLGLPLDWKALGGVGRIHQENHKWEQYTNLAGD